MWALHRYSSGDDAEPSGLPYASFRFASPLRSAFTSLPISDRPASTVSSIAKSNFARRCSVMTLMPAGVLAMGVGGPLAGILFMRRGLRWGMTTIDSPATRSSQGLMPHNLAGWDRALRLLLA